MALRHVSVVFVVWALLAPLRAQTQVRTGPGTAQISGTVVTDEDSPVPLRRARVTVSSTDGNGGVTVVTDDAGRFVAGSLAAGRYVVSASRAGFVRGALGARQPGASGVPLAIEAGQHSTGHVVRVARGAVITGVLRDAKGRGVGDLAVTLSRLGYKDGRRVRLPGAGVAVTDDQGVYRIYGLKPGEYFVSTLASVAAETAPILPTRSEDVTRARALVTSPAKAAAVVPRPPAPLSAAVIYYPGVTAPAQAMPVRVGKGEERTGVDFVVGLQPTAAISAVVLLPDGSPAPTGFRFIARLEGEDNGVVDEPMASTNRPSGFAIFGLLPGTYSLHVEAPDPAVAGVMAYWAQASVQVGDVNIDGVVMQLSPSMAVSGRIAYEGVSDADRPKTEVAISMLEALVNRHISTPSSRSAADGSFTLRGVSPRSYQFTVRPPQGWFVKSIRRTTPGSDDIDHADVPLVVEPGVSPSDLVVTLTRNSTKLSGLLTDEVGRAATDFQVVVFSTDERYWTPRSRRIQAVRPASDGKFSVTGLPEGDYLIAALTDLEDGEWFDRQFLTSISSAAIKVKVSEAAPTVQAIRIAR